MHLNLKFLIKALFYDAIKKFHQRKQLFYGGQNNVNLKIIY